MATTHCNRELNDVLISLGKSLLQYVGECWPWMPGIDEAAVRATIESLVNRQKSQIARLVDLLQSRIWPIDFGTYPTDYTDLHFVGLDFLLPQVLAGEQALVDEIEQAGEDCANDPEARQLLSEIEKEQQEIANGVGNLLASHASKSTIS